MTTRPDNDLSSFRLLARFGVAVLIAIAAAACHRNAVVVSRNASYYDALVPDFSAVDEFWRLKDELSADREPSSTEWERFRATPGYRLTRRVYDDALLEDMRTAYMPSRRLRYDSLIMRGGGRASRLLHLVRAASLRPQLRAFRDSLARADIIHRAVASAARYLPPGVTDSSETPFVAFALFADDGYSFGDSVLVDLVHAYDTDVVSFLAHEFHHTYVERLATKPVDAVEDPDDLNLVIALHSLRNEGIADLIDKPYPLPITSAAMAAYTEKYNAEYARTPVTLRALDSLLREVAADSMRIADAGKRARTLLWSSGHANGAYMAREILTTFGVDSLLPATRNPAAFLRTFAAAEQAHGRAPPFSSAAMRVVGMLEQRYWSRSSASK